MNGLQLQSQLAATGCRIPIIFITAHDDKESRRRAMQAGAIAFLGKPFTDEQLLQCIRSALHEIKSRARSGRESDLRSLTTMSRYAGPLHDSSNLLAFEQQPLNLPRAFLALAN